ncbi:MAG: hypothetical protein EXR27_22155 [Betaproteobacteria bacterium]|nr:hypothetical protein [Betaproteobacteria bacterium]
MIYTVEETLKACPSDEFWDKWAGEMKTVAKILTVPGFTTGQRFKCMGIDPAPSLALYSVDAAEVMTSQRYYDNGGGKLGAPRWKDHLAYWHRNLFEGLYQAPEVPDDKRLLVIDSDKPDVVLEGLTVTWLKCVGLDQTVAHRGLVIVDQPTAEKYVRNPHQQVRVFFAKMPRMLVTHP